MNAWVGVGVGNGGTGGLAEGYLTKVLHNYLEREKNVEYRLAYVQLIHRYIAGCTGTCRYRNPVFAAAGSSSMCLGGRGN